MRRRDPQDQRRDERLAGSSLASLLLHLLAAAFLVSIAAASSQESSTEMTYGGTLTITQEVAQAITPRPARAVTPRPAPPQPPVHRVAPAQRPPQHPLTHPHVALHELTQIVPSAPPNPTPIPAFTPQPLPAPTLNVAFARPTIAPSTRPAPKALPTLRPTIAPTAKPAATPAPTAKPAVTAAPTAKPVPTAAPTRAPAPVVARTAAPLPTAPASPHPARTAGVPSPRPAIAQHPTTGRASPGPPSQSVGHRNVPQRPISIAPTPSPAPRARPHPAPTRNPYAGLNARLNALLPHGPVTPHEGHYVGSLSLAGHLVPTPPPSVLARTRYLFEGVAGGGDGMIRMWVTSLQRRGPVLLCYGWILHFPASIGQGILTAPGVPVGPLNGIQIGQAHQVPSGFAAGMAPIVMGMGTSECTQRALAPFTPPAR